MKVLDRSGKPLHIGDAVTWHDPQEEFRDLERIWHIDGISLEIVEISDEFSQAEVYPEELSLIKTE